MVERTTGKMRRKGPKIADARHLENAALHYLGRFASSSANLRRILMRKVERSARAHGSNPAEGERIVDDIITRYLRAGLLDDAAYASQQAASLRRRGKSRYGIRGKLVVKGVAAEIIDSTIETLDREPGEGDLAAACALVRRRRLGPFRSEGARIEYRRKDLATLARAGFSLDVARRVLSVSDAAALDALARDEATLD